VEGGAGIHSRSGAWRLRGRYVRSPDVWTGPVLGIAARSQRSLAGLQRIHCHLRMDVRDMGMFKVAVISRAVCGCSLHHSRELVHRIDILCESRGRSVSSGKAVEPSNFIFGTGSRSECPRARGLAGLG